MIHNRLVGTACLVAGLDEILRLVGVSVLNDRISIAYYLGAETADFPSLILGPLGVVVLDVLGFLCPVCLEGLTVLANYTKGL